MKHFCVQIGETLRRSSRDAVWSAYSTALKGVRTSPNRFPPLPESARCMQSLLPPESVPLVDDAEWFVGLPLPAALVLVHNCEYAQALADPRLGADGVRSVCTRAHVRADARACLHKLMTEAEVAAGVSPDQCQCCYMQLLVHTTFLKSGRPQHRVKTNLIRLHEKGMLRSLRNPKVLRRPAKRFSLQSKGVENVKLAAKSHIAEVLRRPAGKPAQNQGYKRMEICKVCNRSVRWDGMRRHLQLAICKAPC